MYDPIPRGPFPVGVQTLQISTKTSNARSLPLEIWYPATDRYRQQDFDDTRDFFEWAPGVPKLPQSAVRDATIRPGCFPLVLFSHGLWGHRRQSTFLLTHLASHGYVTASANHVGNTAIDRMRLMQEGRFAEISSDVNALLDQISADRRVDLRAVLDHLLKEATEPWQEVIDADRVGLAGHSWGACTVLDVTAEEERGRAIVAMAPGGGPRQLSSEVLDRWVHLDWPRPVPSLLVAASRDSLTPLAAVDEVYARLPENRRQFLLHDADHVHFVDQIEETHTIMRQVIASRPPGADRDRALERMLPAEQLCPGKAAHCAVRGLVLAHFDGHLKGLAHATSWLGTEAEPSISSHGAHVEQR